MKSISFGPPRVLPNSFGLPKYPWNTTKEASIDRVILPYLRDIFKCASKTQIVKMMIVAITMILIYHARNTLWVDFLYFEIILEDATSWREAQAVCQT